MRIYISADMEGISGIFRGDQVSPGNSEYERARRYLTWDVNACAEGLFAAGAAEVLVRDGHCAGGNLLWDELDHRVTVIQGDGATERFSGLTACDAMILLGYHAMSGTRPALMCHTMSSLEWQRLWINGRESGELAVDAGIAGDFDIPVIMVSGDDYLAAECAEFLGDGVVAVEVKKAVGRNGAMLFSKETAHKSLRDGAVKAARGIKDVEPYKVSRPVTLRLELTPRSRMPMKRHGVKLVNGSTYEVSADNVELALNHLCF